MKKVKTKKNSYFERKKKQLQIRPNNLREENIVVEYVCVGIKIHTLILNRCRSRLSIQFWVMYSGYFINKPLINNCRKMMLIDFS